MTKLYDWEKLFYGTTVAYPPAGWTSPLLKFNYRQGIFLSY